MLTPENLAELRRLLAEYRSASGFAPIVDAWYALARGSIARLPDLLDTAAERNALAAKVERVRALHQPCRCGSGNTHCDVCETLRYPCPTIDALDADRNEAGR